MKKHTILSELGIFFAVFFLFIAYPLGIQFYYDVKPGFVEWNFPWSQMIHSLVCILLLLFYYEKKNSRPLALVLKVFPVIMTFGLLFCVSLFCRAISMMISDPDLINGEINKPDTFIEWIFCIFTFLFAAFNEEVIYRFYFADKLNQILSIKIQWRGIGIVCEVLCCVLFALAHFYLGWISVANAALAHIILRLCYKKSGMLWPCIISHLFYNIISMILL